jgi:hypothetical protein
MPHVRVEKRASQTLGRENMSLLPLEDHLAGIAGPEHQLLTRNPTSGILRNELIKPTQINAYRICSYGIYESRKLA